MDDESSSGPPHSTLLALTEPVDMNDKKSDLVFGREDKEDLTKDTNVTVEVPAKGKEPVRMNDEESTLILDHGEREDFAHGDLVLGVEEEEEYMMDNSNDEESEDDMLDQGDMKEGVKNEEFPKEANVVIGGEQEKENVKEEMDPEENEDKLANEEVKPSSKNIVGKLGKRGNWGGKKSGLIVTNDVNTKTTNDKASSGHKTTKKDESMGMIFMCNSNTKKDCYRHKVFGLPAGKREIVLKIKNGMKLFLYDTDLKLLYGIYKAAGPGGYNIEPKAFRSGFPSQVRFKVSEDCLPLPEEKFKRIIKDNYYQKNKFDFQLTSEQVKNLCKLFRATSNGSRMHGIGKAETHTLTDQERNTKQRYRVVPNRNVDHRVEPYRNLDQVRRVRKRPHREVSYRNVDQDQRARKRPDVEIPYRNVDQDRRARKRHREQERHHTSVRDLRYEENRNPYNREENASQRVPLLLQPRLSPVTRTVLHPPSYAYEEPMKMNAYRRDPLFEQGSGQLFDLESRRREQIERRALHQHHNRPFLLDAEFRHHEVIEHRGPQVRYWPCIDDPSYAASQREYRTTRYGRYRTNLQPEYRRCRRAYRY